MTKLFDAVIIASDKNGVTKVRFCTDLQTRLKVLKRDKFTVLWEHKLPNNMSKEQVFGYLIENEADLLSTEHAELVVKSARKSKKVAKVTVTDILNAVKQTEDPILA